MFLGWVIWFLYSDFRITDTVLGVLGLSYDRLAEEIRSLHRRGKLGAREFGNVTKWGYNIILTAVKTKT